jgi:CheY-like chemotaxis protein
MDALLQDDGKRSMTVGLSAMIRAVVIAEEPLSAQQMASLVDDTRRVKVIGTATDGLEGLRLCNQLLPEAVFLVTNVSGYAGVSLATQLTMLAQPPRLVFSAGNTAHAVEAFRLKAVDYLLKPLDPLEVAEAVERLMVQLRPLEFGSFLDPASRPDATLIPARAVFPKPPMGFCRLKVRTVIRSDCSRVTRSSRWCAVKGAHGSIPCAKSLLPAIPWPNSWAGSVAVPSSNYPGRSW